MAVTNIVEQAEARSGSLDFENKHRYRRVLLVETNNKQDGTYTVIQAVAAHSKVGLPGSPYRNWSGSETDAQARLLTIDAKCTSVTNTSGAWLVTLDYGAIEISQEEAAENPLDRRPEKSWTFSPTQEPIIKDVHGAWILNKAGDPLDPQVTRDHSPSVLVYTRNEASFDDDYAESVRDHINSDTFLGHPARTVKIGGINATEQFENEVLYYRITYEFQFNNKGWQWKGSNEGLREKVLNEQSGEYEVRNILDANGAEITTPALLDNEGKKLPPDGTPVELEVDRYEEMAFSTFNIT